MRSNAHICRLDPELYYSVLINIYKSQSALERASNLFILPSCRTITDPLGIAVCFAFGQKSKHVVVSVSP